MRLGAAFATLASPPVIRFGRAARGRVTGWAVDCSVHGAMPVLCPDRVRGRSAAMAHLEHEHKGFGKVVEMETPRKSPPRKSPQRRLLLGARGRR